MKAPEPLRPEYSRLAGRTLKCLLDRTCNAARSRTEEPVTGFHDFLGGVCILALASRGRAMKETNRAAKTRRSTPHCGT